MLILVVLRQGEILGIVGLVGSGRTEMAQCIFGFLPRQISRDIFLCIKQPIKIKNCAQD